MIDDIIIIIHIIQIIYPYKYQILGVLPILELFDT